MIRHSKLSFLVFCFLSPFVLCDDTANALCDDTANALCDDTSNALETQLSKIIFAQADDWNRGDIDAFMNAYWKSQELSFSSGGETFRGWETTRNRYKSKYPDRATMGKLTFTSLEVEQLGERVAMMLGRWQLERKDFQQADQILCGNFTLVWRKIDNEWLIIHDHSSLQENE